MHAVSSWAAEGGVRGGKALLIFTKVYFREKNNINRNNKGHFIMIKGSIHQDNLKIMNMYRFNSKISKYMKQKPIKLKGEK